MEAIFQKDLQKDFSEAIEDLIMIYCNMNVLDQASVYSAPMDTAKEDFKQLLFDSNFNFTQIPKLLADKNFDEEKIAFFVRLLDEKKSELLCASLINQYSEYGDTVVNFDCILKLILGTSELNTSKYPVMQLVLSSINSGIHQTYSYEINKNILQKLITTLEGLM